MRLLYPKVVPRSVKQNWALPKAMSFSGDVSHIPRREELTFFYVNRTTGLRSGTQQIRLPAEKRRDLQHVDFLPGNLGLSRGMDIGCHRNPQFAPDVRENIATFTHADSAKRAAEVRFALS